MFNNAAATEIKERVRKLLEKKAFIVALYRCDAWIVPSTYAAES